MGGKDGVHCIDCLRIDAEYELIINQTVREIGISASSIGCNNKQTIPDTMGVAAINIDWGSMLQLMQIKAYLALYCRILEVTRAGVQPVNNKIIDKPNHQYME